MTPIENNAFFIHFLGVVSSIAAPRRTIEDQLLPHSLDLLPELVQSVRMKQNHHHHLDVFDHTVAVVEACRPMPILRLAALFHDLGKVPTRRVEEDGRVTFHGHEDESAKIALRVLNFNPAQAETVAWLCARHMDLKAAGTDGLGLPDKSLRKLIAKAPDPRLLPVLLDLCHADNISHAPASCMPDQVSVLRERFKEVQRKMAEKVSNVLTELLNGSDLLKLQPGRAPGPWVREMLEAVAEAERLGLVDSREAAMHLAERRFNSEGDN